MISFLYLVLRLWFFDRLRPILNKLGGKEYHSICGWNQKRAALTSIICLEPHNPQATVLRPIVERWNERRAITELTVEPEQS